MLEITIDDNTDMNEVREIVRQYYLQKNINTNIKPTKTKEQTIGDNDTDSIKKDIRYIGGKTYCSLDMFGFNEYCICKEDGCVYRIYKGELRPIKSSLWTPNRQSKSAALIVSLFNGTTYTTKQVKVLYATCYVYNPFKYKYIEVIDKDYSHISEDNLRWVEKRPRG